MVIELSRYRASGRRDIREKGVRRVLQYAEVLEGGGMALLVHRTGVKTKHGGFRLGRVMGEELEVRSEGLEMEGLAGLADWSGHLGNGGDGVGGRLVPMHKNKI